MRRAAPILALALAAGCMLDAKTDTGRADIYWTFHSQSLGDIGAFTDTATFICTKAAVEDVRITFTTPAGDVLQPSDHPCIDPQDVPGAAFTGLRAGTWGYLLEARRGGVTVFERWGTFEAADGVRTAVDARAVPPPGNWDLIADYATGACAAGDRLDFELFDTSGPTRVTAFSTHGAGVNPPVNVPCGSGWFTLPSVAPGAYESSDWVHVDAAGGVVYEHAKCRPAWTQPNDATVRVAVDVTAAAPPPEGNPGVCL
ncbi:MAG: hypothetical protein WCC48_08815 [Anaeromyxobacteraceae bacterium]